MGSIFESHSVVALTVRLVAFRCIISASQRRRLCWTTPTFWSTPPLNLWSFLIGQRCVNDRFFVGRWMADVVHCHNLLYDYLWSTCDVYVDQLSTYHKISTYWNHTEIRRPVFFWIAKTTLSIGPPLPWPFWFSMRSAAFLTSSLKIAFLDVNCGFWPLNSVPKQQLVKSRLSLWFSCCKHMPPKSEKIRKSNKQTLDHKF